MTIYNCFLLSYLKYGDNDAILHCFTEELGYQSFFAKGIYSQKNKKKPYLLPLVNLQISAAKKFNSSGIAALSKIEMKDQIYDSTNVKNNSVLFFMADFLHHLLKDEQKNLKVFISIQNFLTQLGEKNIDAYSSFLIQFLKISGVLPLISNGKFLNPETGIFGNEISHHLFDEETSAIWKLLLKSENPYEVRLKRNQRNEFVDSVMFYCHCHFIGFRTPKSLEVLRQIYE